MPPPFCPPSGTRELDCANAGDAKKHDPRAAIATVNVRFQPAPLRVVPELMNRSSSGSFGPSSITAVTRVSSRLTPTLPQPFERERYHPQTILGNQTSCGRLVVEPAPPET